MSKSELVHVISSKVGQSRKKAEEIINLIFDLMTRTLANGGRIEIRGFGSFVNRQYGTYTGRNPRSGVSITVSPKKLPFFKVGKELRLRVDGKWNPSLPDDNPEAA